MNSSRTTMAGKHIVRTNKRIWVTPKGKVVSEGETTVKTAAKPTTRTIDWDANIVNVSDKQVVESYPNISGLDQLSYDDDEAKKEIITIYADRLRFADKPGCVETLKQRIASGEWEVHITMKDVSDAPNH